MFLLLLTKVTERISYMLLYIKKIYAALHKENGFASQIAKSKTVILILC